MGGLFDYDSGFSVLFRRCAGCLILNGLWLLCCIPVVTAGAGSAAIYYAMEKYVVREESHIFTSFWRSFKENFGIATRTWLVLLAAGLFLGWDFYFFFQMLRNGNAEGILCVVIAILLALLILTAVYAFSYIARFQDNVRRTLKNSLLLMLSHPLVNLKIVFLGVLLIISALFKPLFLLFLPGVCCWLIDLSMEKIFKRLTDHSAENANS